jgi:hypothetical protein
MGRGPNHSTAEQFASRKIPAWVHEAFEGLSATDLIRAASLYKVVTGRSGHKAARTACGWCGDKGGLDFGMCLACRKREDAQWRVRVEGVSPKGRKVVPPTHVLDERLRRVEAALFTPDGVGRVEDGPFAPESIQQMIRAGAEAEKDQAEAERVLAEMEFDGKLD